MEKRPWVGRTSCEMSDAELQVEWPIAMRMQAPTFILVPSVVTLQESSVMGSQKSKDEWRSLETTTAFRSQLQVEWRGIAC